jgi:methanogenic corrinoid protein MtbC1
MTISAVERDTGIGKETLRVWERRYGFPAPSRDAHGERLYPAAQVERLRQIKRLMDLGFRPGRLVGASDEELAALSAPATTVAASAGAASGGPLAAALERILASIRTHDAAALRQALAQAMMRQGLHGFVRETVAALNVAVGEAWMRGEIEVFEEHLYTEQMQAVLRQAIASLPRPQPGRPRVLLTTVPEEQHVLGLLMAEALLTLEGAACTSLGTQTPLLDIRRAAEAQRADIVALSFSAAFPGRQIGPLAAQLRALLPAPVALWIGGSGAERLPPSAGVRALPRLDDAVAALAEWRDGHPARD